MQLNNPIILKELIQAARHRRMYLVRALLPALALLMPIPGILIRMQFVGQDWRMIAEIGKSCFETCVWLEFLAFSLLAFLYSMAAVRDEWSSRTMEVLCASPLSAVGIVYGKFAAALGRVLLVGLAMLPGLAMVLQVARIPWEMGLGCMAVIAGSALLYGTIGLLQAILFSAGRSAGLAWFGILAPYFLIAALLNASIPGDHCLLLAIQPHRALSLVLNGGMPGGIGPGWFSLVSLGVLTALSLTGLALAPRLFRRAFEHHVGAAAPTRWFPTFKRWLRGHRPKMGERESPFYWQEKGPTTRLLRWATPLVYLVCLLFLLLARGSLGDSEIIAGTLTVVGLLVLFAASAFYGASVFARDRKWGRAQALLLTGRRPAFFLGAKIHATYRALWFSLVLVGTACSWTLSIIPVDQEDQLALGLIMGEALLLGPATGVMIGMTFSLAASSTTMAILGLLSSVLFGMVGFSLTSLMFFAFSRNQHFLAVALILAVFAFVLAQTRLRRNVWILGLVLATCFWTFVLGTGAYVEALPNRGAFWDALVGSSITWVIAAFWCGLAFRSFEQGMMEGSRS